jgi:hypothetical protein
MKGFLDKLAGAKNNLKHVEAPIDAPIKVFFQGFPFFLEKA